jgi:hypothetical protein
MPVNDDLSRAMRRESNRLNLLRVRAHETRLALPPGSLVGPLVPSAQQGDSVHSQAQLVPWLPEWGAPVAPTGFAPPSQPDTQAWQHSAVDSRPSMGRGFAISERQPVAQAPWWAVHQPQMTPAGSSDPVVPQPPIGTGRPPVSFHGSFERLFDDERGGNQPRVRLPRVAPALTSVEAAEPAETWPAGASKKESTPHHRVPSQTYTQVVAVKRKPT